MNNALNNTVETEYRVMRGWQDGEMMQPHLLGAFNRIEDAVAFRDQNGGWVERSSDGATLAPNSDGADWLTD
jgi:hypothetical protein